MMHPLVQISRLLKSTSDQFLISVDRSGKWKASFKGKQFTSYSCEDACASLLYNDLDIALKENQRFFYLIEKFVQENDKTPFDLCSCSYYFQVYLSMRAADIYFRTTIVSKTYNKKYSRMLYIPYFIEEGQYIDIEIESTLAKITFDLNKERMLFAFEDFKKFTGGDRHDYSKGGTEI